MNNFLILAGKFSSMALIATLVLFSSFGVVNASKNKGSLVPSCTITLVPMGNGVNMAKLKWTSTEGAIFASLDNGIGNIAPDGEMFVSPDKYTIYTMHSWNSQGEGGYCSTIAVVNGDGTISAVNPNVVLQTLAIYPAGSSVNLGNAPYTGMAENVIYTLFLLVMLLTAGFVATNARKTLFV